MTETLMDGIRAFGDLYSYDTSYMEFMLEAAPEAYGAFSAVQGLSEHRQGLDLDAHFVARVATMRGEECGPCTQLTLRMAVAAGVRRDLLETVIEHPEELPGVLRDVYAHARSVATGNGVDPDRTQRLRRSLGEQAFVELGLCIAGSSLYPTLKRALGFDAACEAPNLNF